MLSAGWNLSLLDSLSGIIHGIHQLNCKVSPDWIPIGLKKMPTMSVSMLFFSSILASIGDEFSLQLPAYIQRIITFNVSETNGKDEFTTRILLIKIQSYILFSLHSQHVTASYIWCQQHHWTQLVEQDCTMIVERISQKNFKCFQEEN